MILGPRLQGKNSTVYMPRQPNTTTGGLVKKNGRAWAKMPETQNPKDRGVADWRSERRQLEIMAFLEDIEKRRRHHEKLDIIREGDEFYWPHDDTDEEPGG